MFALLYSGIGKLRDRSLHGRNLTIAVAGSPGLFALRVGRDDIARVFFFFRRDREIVCTSGSVKKSRRLDPREIERAERCKADGERRFPQGD